MSTDGRTDNGTVGSSAAPVICGWTIVTKG